MNIRPLRLALVAWANGVLAPLKVIWGEPQSPRPAATFVKLKLIRGPVTIGQDEINPAAVEVQTITFDAVPTDGEFVLGYGVNDSAPMTWEADSDAVQTTLRLLPGFARVIVWGDFEDGFRVILDGVANPDLIEVISSSLAADGEDVAVEIENNPDLAADLYRQSGPRAFTLSVQAFGDDAMQLISDLQSSFYDAPAMAVLNAAGVSLLSTSEPRAVPALLETKYEERVQMDVEVLATEDLIRDVGHIESVEVDGDIGGHETSIEVDSEP